MDFLTVNIGAVRKATRNGREFLVADGTLIVSDRILNGSLGPGFYPASDVEDQRHIADWDGMPIVVWHPTEKVENEETGEEEEVHVSARHPKVLDKWGVGNVYKNRVEDGKHQAQFWFDVLDLKRVDNLLKEQGIEPILPRLLANEPIELSTGLDPEKEPASKGSKAANGERYTWIARQPFHPDHVAILPDQVGACSVRDGCGVNNVGVVNTWSDASREAAAAARAAKAGAKNDHPEVRKGTTSAQLATTKAAGASEAATDRVGHEKAADAHKAAARLHMSARDTHGSINHHDMRDLHDRAATAHKMAAEEHVKIAQTLNASVLRPEALTMSDDECRNADAAVEEHLKNLAVNRAINAKMCWGKPCDGNVDEMSTPPHQVASEHIGKMNEVRSKHGADSKQFKAAQAEHHKEAMGKLEALQPKTKLEQKHVADAKERVGTYLRAYNKGNPMTKTKFNRKRELAFVTANCACKNDKKKLAAFNKSLEALPDEELERVANERRLGLVVNALKAGKLPKPVVNAEGEGEAVAGVPWVKVAQLFGVDVDPRTDPVEFTAQLKAKLDEASSKLGGGAAPSPPEDDEVVASAEAGDDEDEPTMNGDDEEEDKPVTNDKTANRQRQAPKLSEAEQERRWLATAPASIRNKFRKDKQQLVNRLLVNVKSDAKRKALGEKLFNESTAQLEERLELLGSPEQEQPQSSGIDWSLNSAGGQVDNEARQEEQDEYAELMDPQESLLSIVNAGRERDEERADKRRASRA